MRELTITLKFLIGLHYLDKTQFDYLFHQTATRQVICKDETKASRT